MNPVGMLNEFCQRNPSYMVQYEEVESINPYTFKTKCTFDDTETIGDGIKKDLSKKDAAQKMVVLKSALLNTEVDKAFYRIVEVGPEGYDGNSLEEIWNGCETIKLTIRKKVGTQQTFKTLIFKTTEDK